MQTCRADSRGVGNNCWSVDHFYQEKISSIEKLYFNFFCLNSDNHQSSRVGERNANMRASSPPQHVCLLWECVYLFHKISPSSCFLLRKSAISTIFALPQRKKIDLCEFDG